MQKNDENPKFYLADTPGGGGYMKNQLVISNIIR